MCRGGRSGSTCYLHIRKPTGNTTVFDSLDEQHKWRPAPIGRQEGEEIGVPVETPGVDRRHLARDGPRIGLGGYYDLIHPLGELEQARRDELDIPRPRIRVWSQTYYCQL